MFIRYGPDLLSILQSRKRQASKPPVDVAPAPPKPRVDVAPSKPPVDVVPEPSKQAHLQAMWANCFHPSVSTQPVLLQRNFSLRTHHQNLPLRVEVAMFRSGPTLHITTPVGEGIAPQWLTGYSAGLNP